MQTRERAHCALSVFPFIKKSMIAEATDLQKFKLGANAFLLGMDGL